MNRANERRRCSACGAEIDKDSGSDLHVDCIIASEG